MQARVPVLQISFFQSLFLYATYITFLHTSLNVHVCVYRNCLSVEVNVQLFNVFYIDHCCMLYEKILYGVLHINKRSRCIKLCSVILTMYKCHLFKPQST